jgi:excinuclease ABC subunit C
VVHLPQPAPGVRHFGPYLGGTQARLAVTALHRVRPMAYAGTGGIGSVREMARVRGVDEHDREALVEAITAILQRDPAAVATAREALLERRSRAADRLAFELAARVNSELQALDWITSVQRVTSDEPSDAGLAGWAGGILVRFRLRSGRLVGWDQRACTRARAQRHLAATPAAWADFANHNAELAATLTAGPSCDATANPDPSG